MRNENVRAVIGERRGGIGFRLVLALLKQMLPLFFSFSFLRNY